MLTVINPTTGQTLHSYPALDHAAMEQRINQAQEGFQYWRTTSFSERSALLQRVATLMRAQEDRLAQLMTDEMGKPIREARGEVQKAAWCAEHYAEHGANYLRPYDLPSDASHSYVQHLPLGPVLGILPWNAPFWLAFRFCAPALMAGNTCLLKHDPHVPACAEAIADLFVQAEAPSGVMQNLPLQTPDVAAAIRHPAVQAVSFTGSSSGGSKVAALAAAELKPAVLELGGSDPAIVLADADLEQAADLIGFSRIINAGQSCIAAKRIIVEAPVYDRFLALLEARLAPLKVGNPASPDTDIGPLARDDLRAELARQVDATKAAGARCLLGGSVPDGPGFFYPVTLLADVSNDMPACREETFGPVAVVLKAEDAAHALRLANDTEYGLAGSIWTDRVRGEAMAADIQAGQVVINGLVKTDPRLPSGGIKRSGYGRELGPHGILEFVNVQQVWVGPKQD